MDASVTGERAIADTNTTRYGFVKPEVGASADTWGTKCNQDFDDIDAITGAITTTGSANAYVLTTGLSLAAYVAGQSFDIKTNFANTGAATINVDTLGAKSLTKNGTTALASGDLANARIYRISYDGTQFQVLGELSGTYQPLDATLTAFAGLTTADDRMLDFTGVDTMAVVTYATVLSNIGATTLAAVQANANTFSVAQTISTSGGSDTDILAFGNSQATGALVGNGSGVYMDSNSASWFAGLACNGTLGARVVSGGDTLLTAAPTTLSTNSAGFRGAPQNIQDTAYTLVLGDAGGSPTVNSGTARAYTIPPNSSVAFPLGTVILLVTGGGTITITRGSGVALYDCNGAAAVDANVTVTGGGTVTAMATLYKYNTNTWLVSKTS